MTDAAAKVTSRCGWYVAGATQLGNDDQALLLGYQRWNGGVSALLYCFMGFGARSNETRRTTSAVVLVARRKRVVKPIAACSERHARE
jgi:hypothetical protein